MPTAHLVLTSHARDLVTAVDDLRHETAELAAAGLLAANLDDLLGDPGPVVRWLDDLRSTAEHTANPVLRLPIPSDGTLVQVAYGLSALLVWSAALHCEGRLSTAIPAGALTALGALEHAVGLSGRTARGIDQAAVAIAPAESMLVIG